MYLGRPFLGEYFSTRSRLLLYEYVLAIPSSQFTVEQIALREQASQELSAEVRSQLKADYLDLLHYGERPILQKLGEGIWFICTNVPFIESFWIASSLFLGIALLKGRSFAAPAAWFLPCLVLTEMWLFPPHVDRRTDPFFPTESWLLSHYAQHSPSSSFAGQYQVIQDAWEEFLLQEWSLAPAFAERERRLVSGYLHFYVAKLINQREESRLMGAGWLILAFLSSLFVAYFHQPKDEQNITLLA